MRLRPKYYGLCFILPSLLGLCVFFVLPFIGSLYYTFTQGIADPRFVGLKNFRELLLNSVFRQAAGNTFLFLIFAVPLLLGSSLLLGIIMSKRPFQWQRWALLLPMVIPVSSLSLSWEGLWGNTGLINQIIVAFGGAPVDFLYGSASFPLLILLYLLKNIGYLAVIFTNAILVLPVEYREGFRLDCDSELKYVCYILLPLISPTLIFAAVVAVMNYFLMFRDIYMLCGDDPPAGIYMLQHFMNRNFYNLNYQRLSAAAFLSILCMTLLIGLVLALQRRGIRRVG